MSTSFPGALDTLTNPTGTDALTSPSHAAQHANANDAIEAIEAKVGTGASTATSGTFFQGTGTGTSAWAAITGPKFGSSIQPTALSGATNNWAPTGLSTAYLIRAQASSAVDLTGLTAGTDGRLLHLVNIGSFTITLKHNSGSSSAGNQFLINGAADMALATWGQAILVYSGTDAYWLVK